VIPEPGSGDAQTPAPIDETIPDELLAYLQHAWTRQRSIFTCAEWIPIPPSLDDETYLRCVDVVLARLTKLVRRAGRILLTYPQLAWSRCPGSVEPTGERHPAEVDWETYSPVHIGDRLICRATAHTIPMWWEPLPKADQ
jgi:hypothetical protein